MHIPRWILPETAQASAPVQEPDDSWTGLGIMALVTVGVLALIAVCEMVSPGSGAYIETVLDN